MRFLCLCPTYRKPWSLLEHSLECFLSQTHRDAFLLIYDDFGQFTEQSHDNWLVASTTVREPDMISKYEKMLAMSENYGKFDAFSLWDDDDIYLPNHLEFHDRILRDKEFSYPSKAWTTHQAKNEKDGRRMENSRGKFWASSAMRMDSFLKHGFLKTKLPSFDILNLRRWLKSCSSGDPCTFGDPTYVYRWEDTGAWHSSFGVFSKSSTDEGWYERIAETLG